ncbi:hypothetical protein Hanom_Chr05g00397911 [Helianthus anomalus]
MLPPLPYAWPLLHSLNPIRWMRITNEWLGFHVGHRVRIRAIAGTYWVSPLLLIILAVYMDIWGIAATYVARGLHLCGRTRLGYLSGTETPWVLVGDVS